MAKVDKVIEQIKRLLRVDTRGLTIQEIAHATKVSRITARAALLKMEGAGLLDARIVGNCRLHYLKVRA